MFNGNLSLILVPCLLVILLTESQTFAGEPDFRNWYVGGFGGYLSGKLNSNDPSHEASTGDYDDDSPMAGIFGGYQFKLDNDWVAGAEITIPLYIEKGTAVDKQYYPDLVTYEASYKYALFLAGKCGYMLGNALPYIYASVGFANVDGKTYNVDEDDNYSPGFVQSAAATHFIWQLAESITILMKLYLFQHTQMHLSVHKPTIQCHGMNRVPTFLVTMR